MKVRKGFVSNSSSSSFMGGIGLVEDLEKFDKWIESLEGKIDKYNMPKVIDPNGVDQWGGYEVSSSDKNWELVMPVNSEETVYLNKKAVDDFLNKQDSNVVAKKLLNDNNPYDIVVFSFGNGEGDSAFFDGDDCDYDIDESSHLFSDGQKEIYNGFSKENGIIMIDKTVGAGRNG